MKEPASRSFLAVLFVSSLLSAFLMACDDRNFDPCVLNNTCPPSTTSISGKVLSVSLSPSGTTITSPLAAATIELAADGTVRTTSGDDGSWNLEGVPSGGNQLIKITKSGYPPGYNSFPLSLGIHEYDLQVLESVLYQILVGAAGGSGADPEQLCLILGAAVGFARLEYPQITVPQADVTVGVEPQGIPVTYLNSANQPDPSLTATSAAGAFLMVIPDATVVTSITLTPTKPGKELIGGPQPMWPGSLVVAGVVDPLYTPW